MNYYTIAVLLEHEWRLFDGARHWEASAFYPLVLMRWASPELKSAVESAVELVGEFVKRGKNVEVMVVPVPWAGICMS